MKFLGKGYVNIGAVEKSIYFRGQVPVLEQRNENWPDMW